MGRIHVSPLLGVLPWLLRRSCFMSFTAQRSLLADIFSILLILPDPGHDEIDDGSHEGVGDD